jgi:MFS transporter, ACS family, tartrate transporter
MQDESAIIRRVTRRVLPFLIVCYFVAYLDRSNLGIAALTMMPSLGLSSTEYGFAAGIFFLGYVICEVPSNLLLSRYGARRWIARIMITWGLIAACMALVTGPKGLYAVRILLGIAEAGFFPGVIFYLTFWFPARYRARVFGYFMTAIPLSIVLGAPLSASLLYLEGRAGLQGWQWLFLIEGIPAVALGIVCFFYLTDTPDDAKWLSPEERAWLVDHLRRDVEGSDSGEHSSLRDALLHPKLWLMSFVNLGLIAGAYGIVFFLPQIISGFGFSKMETGVITALPFLAGAIGMVVCGRDSDRSGERRLHLAIPMFIAVAGYLSAGLVEGAVPKTIALIAAAFGTFSAYAPFWPFLPMFLKKGVGAAAGVAAINTIGSLAGFGAPYLMGYVKQHTGSYNGGLLVIACLMLLAALVALTFPSKDVRTVGVPSMNAR